VACQYAANRDAKRAKLLCTLTKEEMQRGISVKQFEALLKYCSEKEGGKRGVEIEGASDMGGLCCFCTTVEKPEGDIDLLDACVDAMNAKSDPTEEERKGGSGHIAKMIFSDGEHLAIVCYVPKEMQEREEKKLNPVTWLQETMKELKEESAIIQREDATGTKTYALIKCEKESGKFAIKMKDEALRLANAYLQKNGLFPEGDDDDEDEMVFGDDDFPS